MVLVEVEDVHAKGGRYMVHGRGEVVCMVYGNGIVVSGLWCKWKRIVRFVLSKETNLYVW